MPALVSEFNCFLRSRCSMEMWCPDDIGRDSWDWVGPPAWGRACFNYPKWGGGSSPVKTEPPQIVLLLLWLWLFQTRRSTMRLSQRYQTTNCAMCGRTLGPGVPATLSPRRRRTLRHRGLPKKSAESWDSTSKWTESEKCSLKKAKSHLRLSL